MAQLLLVLVGALVVGALGFGIAALIFGGDPGLAPAEPDGRAVPLPRFRPLIEADIGRVRFDTGLRGYRMAQVDAALARAAYDLGYKEELINVLTAEVDALRDGRLEDADVLRRARETATRPSQASAPAESPAGAAAPAEVPAGRSLADHDAAGSDGVDNEVAGSDGVDHEVAGDDGRQREETRFG